jgi:hypothetical protein
VPSVVGRHVNNSPRWSCPESSDAREDDDSTERVAQMNPVRVRDGQPDHVDGRHLHDHDCAAENDEERAKPPLHSDERYGLDMRTVGLAPLVLIREDWPRRAGSTGTTRC